MVAFSGCLYNAELLRPRVKPKPKDKSDASLVLSLYKMTGRKCVHYLDGAFAFVLREGDKFYAARDPMGEEPLYYAKTDEGWLFASELKAFPKSYRDVAFFPPGCYFDSEIGPRRYFKLPSDSAQDIPLQQASDWVQSLVTEAVEKRIAGAREVGVFLTGSVESGILSHLVKQKRKHVKTFSVGLAGTSDGTTARRVAEWLGTEHHHSEITVQEILDNLQQIIYRVESFDAMVVRRAVMDFFVSQQAREHVDVLLSGVGADEVFGGYGYLRPMFPEKLKLELRNLTSDLHRTHLQRWGRITAMHKIVGRAPYVDTKVVHAAFCVPPVMKVNEEGRTKWVLRRAFSTSLPAWVIDRPDAEDVHAPGIEQALLDYASTVFTDEDLLEHKRNEKEGLPAIRTKDELLYYQIWCTQFPKEHALLVGRTHL
jgi:asparagine synthase (glutamine-hydrolysing)